MPTYHTPGVYIEELPGARPIEGVATAVAAFVGVTEIGGTEPKLVTSWPEYTRTFGQFFSGGWLPRAVDAFFANGGNKAYIVNVAERPANLGTYRIWATMAAKGEPLKVTVSHPTPAEAKEFRLAAGSFILTVDPGGDPKRKVVIRNLLPIAGTEGAAAKVNQLRTLIAMEEIEPTALPNVQTVALPAAWEGAAGVVAIEAGKDPKGKKKPTAVADKAGEGTESDDKGTESDDKGTESDDKGTESDDKGTESDDKGTESDGKGTEEGNALKGKKFVDAFIGGVTARTGLGALEAIDEVTIVLAPDIMGYRSDERLSAEQATQLQGAIVAHCERMKDRMGLLDAPKGKDAQTVREWRNEDTELDHGNYSSAFSALYWPWLRVPDPVDGQDLMPPSGHIAGIWCRTDETRGVHKAPANEDVRGAVALELNANTHEQELLNPIGINAIRSFRGRGMRVWGARTMAVLSDPQWKYVNIRRYFNYLEESIMDGTQWCVFEPNDTDLWSRLRREIEAFLMLEWRKGALFGRTPAQAFFVTCDESVNPEAAINAGQVTCLVGVAPVKPAEFVIFQLSQYHGGAEVTE